VFGHPPEIIRFRQMRLEFYDYIEVLNSANIVADLNAGFTHPNIMIDVQLAESHR
jgi:hypothetical protein